MPGRIIRRPQAVSDAEECAVYLGSKETDDLALRFLMALEWTLEFLAENPGTGKDRGFRSPTYRDICSWSIKGFPNHSSSSDRSKTASR
jgi:plasmid stabilization system protein ParE